MDLLEDNVNKEVANFTKRMDSISKEIQDHLNTLKTAQMDDIKKAAVNFEKFVLSLMGDNGMIPSTTHLRTGKEITFPPSGRQPTTNVNKIGKQTPLEEPEGHSDDDFLIGPVHQKPKKQLCLSIKKSVKTKSKCTAGKWLLDCIPDGDAIFTPKTPSASGRNDQPRTSLSQTTEIKESTFEHPCATMFTESEQLHSKSKAKDQVHKESEQPRVRVHEPSNTGEVDRKMDFKECRVVIRKLSTSLKIFQPKVVLRKLSEEEMRKLCGDYPISVGPRYTSLTLEPAKRLPRTSNTIRTRKSVTRLVLTLAEAKNVKEDVVKEVDLVSNEDIVKSMFRTKSKCVQEWRSMTRTKDQGRRGMNPRSPVDLPRREQDLAAAQTYKPTAKRGRETKRSKCVQGSRITARTKPTRMETAMQTSQPEEVLQKLKEVETSKICREFAVKEENTANAASDAMKKQYGQQNPAPTSSCDRSEQMQTKDFKQLKETKPSHSGEDRGKPDPESRTPKKNRCCKERPNTFKHVIVKDPKKTTHITPTRLKYSIKTTRSANTAMLQESQLTFLIESLRR